MRTASAQQGDQAPHPADVEAAKIAEIDDDPLGMAIHDRVDVRFIARDIEKIARKNLNFRYFCFHSLNASTYLHEENSGFPDCVQVLTRTLNPSGERGLQGPAWKRPRSMESSQLQEYAHRAGLVRPSILWDPLSPGESAVALDADRWIYPASTIKTPLAAAALLLVARGEHRLGERRPVDPANLTLNDAPSPIEAGYPASLEELCRYAVDRSDNVATNELFDRLGRERATSIVREELGLEATGFYRKLSGSDPLIADPEWDGEHRNAHPVRDAARLFRAIAERSFPGAALLEGWLAAQQWNDKLNLGLAPGDRFAHKTGDTSEVTHDGGILTTGDHRRAAIVVYTEMPSTPENNARFGTFMRLLRDEAFRDAP